MERKIPHIRSIFASASPRKNSSSDTQDLCVYEKSPRSRRKPKDTPSDYDRKYDATKNTSPKKKTDNFGKENYKSKQDEEPRKSGTSSRNLNYNTYSSKTLTERDMRHLERHLSMKKTIRKQISRNLAQALLENPSIFEPEEKVDVQKPDKNASDRRSEENVLDLLKISIEDRDSGHSSPTHDDNLEDTDEDEDMRNWRSSTKHRSSETKGLMDDRPKHQDSERKSIWKMFSSRSKARR